MYFQPRERVPENTWAANFFYVFYSNIEYKVHFNEVYIFNSMGKQSLLDLGEYD